MPVSGTLERSDAIDDGAVVMAVPFLAALSGCDILASTSTTTPATTSTMMPSDHCIRWRFCCCAARTLAAALFAFFCLSATADNLAGHRKYRGQPTCIARRAIPIRKRLPRPYNRYFTCRSWGR